MSEARRLIDLAGDRGIVLRLLGGLAIQLLTPELPPRTRDGPGSGLRLGALQPQGADRDARRGGLRRRPQLQRALRRQAAVLHPRRERPGHRRDGRPAAHVPHRRVRRARDGHALHARRRPTCCSPSCRSSSSTPRTSTTACGCSSPSRWATPTTPTSSTCASSASSSATTGAGGRRSRSTWSGSGRPWPTDRCPFPRAAGWTRPRRFRPCQRPSNRRPRAGAGSCATASVSASAGTRSPRRRLTTENGASRPSGPRGVAAGSRPAALRAAGDRISRVFS